MQAKAMFTCNKWWISHGSLAALTFVTRDFKRETNASTMNQNNALQLMPISCVSTCAYIISEFRVSETARSWARIRDKNNFSPHEHTSGKEVSVEFP